jgi:hypothetical protein
MAAALSVKHGAWAAANVASLLDDELTADVTFVISDKSDVQARGSIQNSLIRRVDADVGASKESHKPFVACSRCRLVSLHAPGAGEHRHWQGTACASGSAGRRLRHRW